jgi:hypothetical protein
MLVGPDRDQLQNFNFVGIKDWHFLHSLVAEHRTNLLTATLCVA